MKTTWAFLLALLLLAAPAAVRAQMTYTYTTNNGAITLTGYADHPPLGGGVVISNFVTSIGTGCFSNSYVVNTILIPASVTNIGDNAFTDCGLTAIQFAGSPPVVGTNVFTGDSVAMVYYLPYTPGWSNAFAGLPAQVIPCTFTTNGSALTITGNTGVSPAVAIPASINGLPVTSIGTGAFYDCGNLNIVVIPGSVTNIAANAFSCCSNLMGVYFASNAPITDPTAFTNDSNATLYYSSGSSGWASAFAGLPTAVVQSQNYQTYPVPGGIGIMHYRGSGGAGFIPAAIGGQMVTTLWPGSFEDKLSGWPMTISIPASVTSIGSNAFAGNDSSLSSVAIPASVTNIAGGAFERCWQLSSVYFGGSPPVADSSVFSGDVQVTVYYSSGAPGWGSSFAGFPAKPIPYTFTTNDGTITLTGPNGTGEAVMLPATINGLSVTCIASNAFQGYGNLSVVGIPACITNIAADAFAGCANLTGIYFQGNPPTADTTAFSSDSSATIYYDANATIGWSSTFAGLPTAEVQFPFFLLLTLYSGQNYALGYTGSGGAVAIPPFLDNWVVNGIYNKAFANCASLTSVSIPATIADIESGAFMNCTGLSSITLPFSLTNIGYEAFDGCTGLATVAIPSNVTNIGYGAFAACTSVTAIAVDTNNLFYSSVNGVLFDISQSLLIDFPGAIGGSYTIPASVGFIGSNAFQGCANLTSVTVPAAVTNIGDSAFAGCSNLASVYFQGNAPTADSTVFSSDANVTVYYLPGTTGWTQFAANTGLTPVPWNPLIQPGDGGFGLNGNQFGFNITGTCNITFVVEACTNMACPVWVAIQTNTLADGPCCFSEPFQPGSPGRFYRIRSP